MTKTTLIGVILAFLALVGVVYILGTDTTNDSLNKEQKQNENLEAKGRVVFSVTDAAVNLDTLSEINMLVSSVSVHSDIGGWIQVSSTPKVYNLLALNAQNKSELLADINLETGSYDQIRLVVDSISIKTKAGATKEAKLPSGELKIDTTLLVRENETASVNLDFLADKSLHVTGNSSYIFAPVVKMETKSNATVTLSTDNTVNISGGQTDNSSTVGMDIDGSVKVNFQLDKNQKLNIGSDNSIKLDVNSLLK